MVSDINSSGKLACNDDGGSAVAVRSKAGITNNVPSAKGSIVATILAEYCALTAMEATLDATVADLLQLVNAEFHRLNKGLQ
jgi:hypothetical protein